MNEELRFQVRDVTLDEYRAIVTEETNLHGRSPMTTDAEDMIERWERDTDHVVAVGAFLPTGVSVGLLVATVHHDLLNIRVIHVRPELYRSPLIAHMVEAICDRSERLGLARACVVLHPSNLEVQEQFRGNGFRLARCLRGFLGADDGYLFARYWENEHA